MAGSVRKKKTTKESSKKESGSGRQGQDNFAHSFLSRIPDEDKDHLTQAELEDMIAALHDLAKIRKPGTHKVSVKNIIYNGDSDHVPHTVICMVNDDMPFIVDSISFELASRSLHIETLLHPVLYVTRTDADQLSKIKTPPASQTVLAESYIFIRLEQILSEAACQELEIVLDSMLSDVRAATSDWQEMLKKMDHVISYTIPQREFHDADCFDETQDFLAYVRQNNFTFLGYQSYKFSKDKGKLTSSIKRNSRLGILKNRNSFSFGVGTGLAEIEELKTARWPVMLSKLIEEYATVHRHVPLDALCIKILDKAGKLTGMHLFVGLFTSGTYSCRTQDVPIVRQKVYEVMERADFNTGSHDQKALEHILEKMPRDELFQVTSDELYTMAMGILRLQEKHGVALFTHTDPTQRYLSCLLYVPRDRHSTKLQMQAEKILEALSGGTVTATSSTMDDSPLARMLFVVRMKKDRPVFDRAAAEVEITALTHEWHEKLQRELIKTYGKAEGSRLSSLYARAFPTAYHDKVMIGNALHDIRQIEQLRSEDGDRIRVDLYRLQDDKAGEVRLKVYHKDAPVPLSDIMPALDNMALSCLSEVPFEVSLPDEECIWIHDFRIRGPEHIDVVKVKENFESAFTQIWHDGAVNDGLNRLIVLANLRWHQVRILRAYSNYLSQVRFPYSKPYMEQALAAYPDIVNSIVDLFQVRHDPNIKQSKKKTDAILKHLEAQLQDVERLDHDRILRAYQTLVLNTLRTNYYQRAQDGGPQPCLSMKFDSKNIDFVPLPRPHVEIFVSSARVEAVHLRGGEIARGGLRWSDRLDDFRTEVLGLVKAQMVKNAVIVPVGAKGGFVVKQPPPGGDREAFLQEGIACYKIFVQALLDLTDNNVGGKLVPPRDVVCYDDPDPYLVVAADKGTAKFSDIANELSNDAGFWLGDAFASGGSAGYDHKGMGITARGAWECVKRHFREIGKNIQKEDFTVIGVGDMGGDVFGNGMLLSKHIRLVAAFNHMHIFLDPDPDAETSFAERKRLFKAVRGWGDYDVKKLSEGGAIFERSAKTLKVSPQVRKMLELPSTQVTPDELIKAILLADVELLWFGGIGTYIKSSKESHADADDRANNTIRVDARDVRAKVIGEGANLGVTQLGRVGYARRGGRMNTDFIDNAGGVNCSDHEVNIKILLNDVIVKKKLTMKARDKLLVEMTDNVAQLVLNDNYQQAQSLSLQEYLSQDQLGQHSEMVRDLEKKGFIVRKLEGLPDEETFAQLIRDRQHLTRPELSILSCWSKITLFNDVMASNVPDSKALEKILFEYFPTALHKYDKAIYAHKLRRGIIATEIVNLLVNRMGPVFVPSRMNKTGASSTDVMCAFMIVTEVFDLPAVWAAIEALDSKVPNDVQIAAHNEVYKVCKRAVTWFLRAGKVDIGKEIKSFKPGIELLKKSINKVLHKAPKQQMAENVQSFKEAGLPVALATQIVTMKILASACDIIALAERSKKADIVKAAKFYFRVGECMHIDWLREQASHLIPANSWEARVVGGLLDDFYRYQAVITEHVLNRSQVDTSQRLALWFGEKSDAVDWFDDSVRDVQKQPKMDLEMLVLAQQWLRQTAEALQS